MKIIPESEPSRVGILTLERKARGRYKIVLMIFLTIVLTIFLLTVLTIFLATVLMILWRLF